MEGLCLIPGTGKLLCKDKAGEYRYLIVENPKSITPMEYRYILFVLDPATNETILCVTAEKNPMTKEWMEEDIKSGLLPESTVIKDEWFLCVFDDDGHHNMGSAKKYESYESFKDCALKVVQEKFPVIAHPKEESARAAVFDPWLDESSKPKISPRNDSALVDDKTGELGRMISISKKYVMSKRLNIINCFAAVAAASQVGSMGTLRNGISYIAFFCLAWMIMIQIGYFLKKRFADHAIDLLYESVGMVPYSRYITSMVISLLLILTNITMFYWYTTSLEGGLY